MTWKSIIVAFARCEVTATYNCIGGYSLSAKGAIAVIAVLIFAVMAIQCV